MGAAMLVGVDAQRPALNDGVRTLTFGELQRVIGAEQQWLQSQGVRRCALLADNGTAWAIADLALLTANIINVPLPGYFTAAQIEHVLRDAGIDAVLTDEPQRFLSEHGCQVLAISGQSGLTLLSRVVDAVPPLPTDTAKVTYTSGSTAAPKGVCLSAATLERVARSLQAALCGAPLQRHFCVLPLATLLENVAGLYLPLLLGIETHLLPLAVTGMSYGKLDPARLLHALERTQPSNLILVPELLRVLVKAVRGGWCPPSTLQFIAVGGASVARELLDEAQRRGLPVYEGYGLSECASVVCLNRPGERRVGSVGRPLPHARVRVDAHGQLHVAGAVLSGYLGEASSPASEVATGDLGRIDADGFVYVHGRARDVFITSMGRNVTPEWVERELLQEEVIGHAMALGEARPHVAALLSPSTAAVTREQLQRAVSNANSRLPDYAQVRAWAAFPEPPTFQAGLLTANGRLRRAVILERHARHIAGLYSLESHIDHIA